MNLYELQISFPKIINAPEPPRSWLKNIFLQTLIETYLNRHNLNHEVVMTDKGPTLKIFKIEEHTVDYIKSYVVNRINALFSSSSILKYINMKDIQIIKKRNFDELVKKLPELEGVF